MMMMMMKIEKDLFNTPQCYCIWKAAMKTPFALTDPQDQMDEALQFRQGFRLPGRVAQSQVCSVTGGAMLRVNGP